VIPKLGDRLVAIIEQGGTAKATFNTIDRTFDSIITTMVFSYYKPNLCTEIVKEQLQTGYNFIYLHSRDLKPLNHEVVSAYRVFRHAGTDVNTYKVVLSQLQGLTTMLEIVISLVAAVACKFM
jgi:hypothetical protein